MSQNFLYFILKYTLTGEVSCDIVGTESIREKDGL